MTGLCNRSEAFSINPTAHADAPMTAATLAKICSAISQQLSGEEWFILTSRDGMSIEFSKYAPS